MPAPSPSELLTCPPCPFLPHSGQHGSDQVQLAWLHLYCARLIHSLLSLTAAIFRRHDDLARLTVQSSLIPLLTPLVCHPHLQATNTRQAGRRRAETQGRERRTAPRAPDTNTGPEDQRGEHQEVRQGTRKTHDNTGSYLFSRFNTRYTSPWAQCRGTRTLHFILGHKGHAQGNRSSRGTHKDSAWTHQKHQTASAMEICIS